MIEVVHMEQTFGDHHIQMIAKKGKDQWDVIARCDDCEKHIHMEHIDFGNDAATLFITVEMSMHASGVDEGWHDGPGFVLD